MFMSVVKMHLLLQILLVYCANTLFSSKNSENTIDNRDLLTHGTNSFVIAVSLFLPSCFR